MDDSQIRDISAAFILPMTEAEFAQYHQRQGTKVIRHRDRFWKETYPGFYQPLHWLADLSDEQASCPPRWNWGFQCSLRVEDSAAANSYMPVHLLVDVEKYDEQSLSANRRYQLRKGRKNVRVLQLTGQDLLKNQGYAVVHSALTRTQHLQPPSEQDYIAEIENDYIAPKHRLIIAGLIEDRLGGYMTGYAIGNTATIEKVYLATDALASKIGIVLAFEFAQVCRRMGNIDHILYGGHTPEDTALCTFKESMQFGVKYIPTKVQINWLMKELISRIYPDKYYHLTGRSFS